MLNSIVILNYTLCYIRYVANFYLSCDDIIIFIIIKYDLVLTLNIIIVRFNVLLSKLLHLH